MHTPYQPPKDWKYSFPNPIIWAVRYRNLLYYRNVGKYQESTARDGFLAVLKTDITALLEEVAEDEYLSTILHLWKQGYHYRKPFSQTLQEIEQVRQKYY